MALLPACERRPLPALGTALPSGVGTRSPHAPTPGSGPAKPPRGPLCSVSRIMGSILRRPVMGLGPGKEQVVPQGPTCPRLVRHSHLGVGMSEKGMTEDEMAGWHH